MSACLAWTMTVLLLGAETGPRLTDADFFAAMDLDRAEMASVRGAVEKQDWPAARKAYAALVRTRTAPQWSRVLREKPKAPAKRPDTTDADKLLAHQWPWQREWFDLGPDIDWASNQMMSRGEAATVEWNASLNRHFHFRQLVEAYQRTGEEKYAAEVVAQMLDWIEDCPVLLDRSGNSPYHHAWETLNAACRAGDTWPNALFGILPSESLTDDALVTVVKSLVEHARHLDRWPTRSGNWLTAESKAVFIVGTLFAEFKEAKTWRRHGIERLYRQMHTDVYPDGLEIELALGYNNWVLRNFAEVLDLARLNDRAHELPADWLARMQAMYDYQCYAVMPHGTVPGLNDSGDASPETLLRAGHAYFPQREDFLWVASGGKEGKRPAKTSVAFPYSGHYVMRSGWDKDARYLLFDAGPFGSGHQHEDMLHLIVCAFGRPLLLDAGNYMYDRSRWRRYALSTRGHNTVRVDGEDQNRRADRATWVLPEPFQPLDNTWVTREPFDYAVGRYESDYGPKREIQVTHTRAVVFVKPDYWVLFDTLQAKDGKEHRYESLFHLNAEETEVDAKTGAVATTSEQGPNLVVWPASSARLAAEVVKGIEEEPVQGWANGPWRPVPTAVFTWQAAGTVRVATVLFPVAPGARCPVRSVEMLPVTAGGKPAGDAAAVRIGFADGSEHLVLAADRAGTERRVGPHATTAELWGRVAKEGKTIEFRHPEGP